MDAIAALCSIDRAMLEEVREKGKVVISMIDMPKWRDIRSVEGGPLVFMGQATPELEGMFAICWPHGAQHIEGVAPPPLRDGLPVVFVKLSHRAIRIFEQEHKKICNPFHYP
jgi:hypothetical protein